MTNPAQPMAQGKLASDVWTGTWRWNVETARYTDPGRAGAFTARTMEVVAEGRERLWFRSEQTYLDGSSRAYIYDGAFDGMAYPMRWEDGGESWATISFQLVTERMGADGFEVPVGDGQLIRGTEHFVLGDDHVEVYGASTLAGVQHPYFEEWHRVI